MDRGPGGGEHRRGDRRVPDHRGTAPAGLGGGVLAAGHHGGTRHADVVREAGAGGARSLGRSGRERPAPGSKLAWPVLEGGSVVPGGARGSQVASGDAEERRRTRWWS